MHISRIRSINPQKLIVYNRYFFRELTFRELFTIRKFQKNRKYDSNYLVVEEDTQHFLYHGDSFKIYEAADFLYLYLR